MIYLIASIICFLAGVFTYILAWNKFKKATKILEEAQRLSLESLAKLNEAESLVRRSILNNLEKRGNEISNHDNKY